MLSVNASPQTKTKTKTAKRVKVRREHKPRSLNHEKILARIEAIRPKHLHISLLFAVLGLCIYGLMMVYSASNYNSTIYYGHKWHFFTSQFIGFILGLVLMSIAYFVDFKNYKKWSLALYIVGAILLVLVFIPGIGISRLGASRWIGIGGFTMQPSEIAKFTFIIFACSMATKAKENNQMSLKTFIIILCAGLSYCTLIFLEPNLSITLCLGMTMFVMLFIFGAKLKHLFVVALPALIALPVMIVSQPYRVRRLLAFIDPWANPKDEGFQLIQSLFGLGNGGFFGVGYGNSTQKHMFLPFSESDFIFSIIGEEFGFIGCIMFIVNLLLIVTMIYRVGIRCDDRFGKYLCFGIASIIFIQSAVNLAVVTGTIPPTGVPLPFISFGGTSLAVYMAAIGIVLNIEKTSRIKRAQSL